MNAPRTLSSAYTGEKEDLIMLLKQFRYSRVEVPENISASSGRRLNTEYKEKLITKVILHYSSKLFLPLSCKGGVHAALDCGACDRGK